MYVIPRAGYKVRDPIMRDHLPAEGREVPDNPFWRRRIMDGDVREGAAPQPNTSADDATAAEAGAAAAGGPQLAPAADAPHVVHVAPGDQVVVDKS